jgi:O-antigen ligase
MVILNRSIRLRDILIFLFAFIFVYIRSYDELTQIVTRIVVPLVAVIAIFKTGIKPLIKGPIRFYTILFLWSLVTVIVATDLGNFVRYSQLFFGVLLIHLILNAFLRSFHDVFVFAFGVVVAALFIIGDAYFSGDLSTSIYLQEENIRSSGIADNPNTFGGILIISTFLSIFLFQFKQISLTVLGIISILIFIAVIQTASRSAILGFAILHIINLFNMYRSLEGLSKFFVLSILAIGTILGFSYLIGVYTELLDNTLLGIRIQREESESNESRKALIMIGIDMIIQNPVFGVGSGNFTNNNKLRLYSHNDIIELAGTLGLFGLCIYGLFFNSIMNFTSATKKIVGRNSYLIRRHIKIFLFTFFVQGLFKPLFIDVMFMMVICLLIVFNRIHINTKKIDNSTSNKSSQ